MSESRSHGVFMCDIEELMFLITYVHIKKNWATKDIGSIIQELSSWNNKDKDIEGR